MKKPCWTINVPTESGFYWYTPEKCKTEHADVVQIDVKMKLMWMFGDEDYEPFHCIHGQFWSEKLTPPEQ